MAIMSVTSQFSTRRLLLRCLTPSSISILVSVCGGLFITALHFLMLSLNEGAFLPQLFDGEWAAFYTNTILQPVLVFLNNSTVSIIFVALTWAIIGLIFYTVVTTVSRTIHNIRESSHATQMVGEYNFRQHPLEKSIILQTIWRIVIGLVMASLVIVIDPIAKHFFSFNEHIFAGDVSVSDSIRVLLEGIGFWILTINVYVVLLRLYLLRTRVFGEILY